MKKSKRHACDVCGRKAKHRIREPLLLYLCGNCAKQVAALLNENGIGVVEIPSCSRAAEYKGRVLKNQHEAHRADIVVTWTAHNRAEFLRAVELGLIGGWQSYEQYEAHQKEVLGHLRSVHVVNATPDEIVAELQRHKLPNTPQGRADLYGLLAKEAIES